jgi:murein DD-endopeptidase MepM/ murein hydrolase activator NlpD
MKKHARLLLLLACVLAGCAIAGQGVYHRVQRGETVWGLARLYELEPARILRYNSIRDPDRLQAGDELFIVGATRVRRGNTTGSPPRPAATLPALTLQWPVAGAVTQTFGRHGQIFNNGVDLAAAAGTTVHAASAGTVAYIGGMQGLGTVVLVEHGRGFLTVYARLGVVSVQQDARVAAGAAVGSVGNMGRGLHFEVRHQGEPHDPQRFLPRR